MVERKDLTNKRFGRLLVLEYAGKSGVHIKYKCLCDCGKTLDVFASNLKTGNTKGCQSCAKTIHGYSRHKLYRRWMSLLRRNQLCEEWKDVAVFVKDVESSFPENALLYRKDTSKPHSFENSFWLKQRKFSKGEKSDKVALTKDDK